MKIFTAPVPYTFRYLPHRDNELCTGCCACLERCPGDAIGIDDSGDSRVLFVECHRCLRCGWCADICPENALSLTVLHDDGRGLMVKIGAAGKETKCRSDGIEVDHDELFNQMEASGMTHHPGGTDDALFVLNKCISCGRVMPVSERQIRRIRERVAANLSIDEASAMDAYVYSCIECRQKFSLSRGTHPVMHI